MHQKLKPIFCLVCGFNKEMFTTILISEMRICLWWNVLGLPLTKNVHNHTSIFQANSQIYPLEKFYRRSSTYSKIKKNGAAGYDGPK
jgi:hypothetical protein